MSEYIVSARKYRPDSFETLIGQDTIARTLSNSIKRGQLAHAYLFCGPRGVGKTTTARIFAKMINCANPGPDMEPCGECESCVSFREGRSYCIHELDAASNNGVEDIKALMEQVQIPPQVGKYSVYIIDEVHMLSQSAFNAFLKTLEEPPAHAIFILATTEKHKILPTILSRCQTYDFNRISISDMVKNLRGIAEKEGVTIDDESLHVIASKADGAMRDALTIFDQTVAFCGTSVSYEDVKRNLGVLDHEYSFSIVDAALAGDYAKCFTILDEVLAKGFNALHFVGSLSEHLRNLVVAKTGGLEPLLELPDSLKKKYAEQGAHCSLAFLYQALGVTTACESGYKAAVNPRLHIEFTLMRLCFLQNKPSAGAEAPVAQPAKPVEQPKPAVQPKVVEEQKPQAEQPVAAAQPRRRAPKTGSALSISAIAVEKPEETAAAGNEEAQDTRLPDDNTVRLKWKELAGQYTSKPRLASMLSSGQINLSDGDGVKVVEFVVMNEAQKQWVEDKMQRELETKLRDLLSCRKVNIVVAVTPEPENAEKVPYMPEEKARDLMEKNPSVREFVAELGLDTK
ncbi:MAG: DNA polymerase III subunit gamma/tau [Bacteroidales bacterium]|nr:DNA polymerase III subunit gamma/tau [Bacteroidales bacterium]